jgi:hypothetical protein
MYGKTKKRIECSALIVHDDKWEGQDTQKTKTLALFITIFVIKKR